MLEKAEPVTSHSLQQQQQHAHCKHIYDSANDCRYADDYYHRNSNIKNKKYHRNAEHKGTDKDNKSNNDNDNDYDEKKEGDVDRSEGGSVRKREQEKLNAHVT